MSELGLQGGGFLGTGEAAWKRRVRYYLLVAAVIVLCGIAYLAGIWSGMHGGMKCVVTSNTEIVCGTSADDLPAPAPPTPTPTSTGSV